KFSQLRNRFVSTIGVFDGVHKGHQFILKKVIEKAQSKNISSLLITFWPDPHIILGKKFLGYLMSIESKIKVVSSLGIDYIFILDTNRNILNTSGDIFIRNIIERFSILELVVGEDFRFGEGAKWEIEELRHLANLFKFKLTVVKKLSIDREIVSSSRIREFILDGEFKRAKIMLGKDYFIETEVIKGSGLGRKIGYPTANCDWQGFVIPKRGVYSAYVLFDGKLYLGAVNIGFKPTVNNQRKISLEVHIIDFNENIVGKKIKIIFLEKIRREKKFSSLGKLAVSIRRDLEIIRKNKYGLPKI
ncbi:MAG: bifunctional riboflavin kinase/FAD synthetase, partial [Candidatus Omnitrophica bacterium]|nr:bifunctional riboflavin kinase/FAD synthetase [Candidatus Omnitrophota bacterium]